MGTRTKGGRGVRGGQRASDSKGSQNKLPAVFAAVVQKVVAEVQGLPPAERLDVFDLLLDLAARLPGVLDDPNKLQAAVTETFTAIGDTIHGRHGSVKTEVLIRAGDVEEDVASDWARYVGDKVVKLREKRELSQVQLAERSGLPQSHISRIERGKLSPSRKTVEKLALGLGVELRDLDPSA